MPLTTMFMNRARFSRLASWVGLKGASWNISFALMIKYLSVDNRHKSVIISGNKEQTHEHTGDIQSCLSHDLSDDLHRGIRLLFGEP